MATTVYGNNVTSLWRSYVEYSTSETNSNYVITLTAKKRGYAVYSTTYSLGDEYADCRVRTTYTLDGGSAVTAESASRNLYGFDGYTSANHNSAYANNAVVITIPKTGATQSLVLAYSVTFPQGYVMWKNNDLEKSIDYTGTSYSSTASVSLTVPKAGSPSITSVDASRDDDTPTTVYVTPHVTSYDGDTFTITMVYGDETVELANETVNTITNMSEDPVTFTVTATGVGGTSAEYTFTLPASFHTFTQGSNGKSVAFGKLASEDASDHKQGLFECAMDMELPDLLDTFAVDDISKLLKWICPKVTWRTEVNDSYGAGEVVLGNLKIAYGNGSIQPSKASTSTLKTFNFGCTFVGEPIVIVGLGGAPEINVLNISHAGSTIKTFDVRIFASNTTSRIIRWIAIGGTPDSQNPFVRTE